MDNLEDAFERCQANQAIFSTEDLHGAPEGEIHRRPWGEVSFYVSDPFGNKLCFVDRGTVFTGS